MNKDMEIAKKWVDFLSNKAPYIVLIAVVIAALAVCFAITNIRNGWTTAIGLVMFVSGLVFTVMSLWALFTLYVKEKTTDEN